MGILKDISTALKDAVDLAKEVNISPGKGASLAKLSSQATLQFPIIISRSIDIDRAQMVGKAFDRKYATFTQIVISLNPYLDLQKDKDMAGYLKKIHQNNPNVLDLVESCMNLYTDETIATSVLFSLNEGASGELVRSNMKQLFDIETCLNRVAVNDLYQPKTMTMGLAESNLFHYCKENGIVLEEAIKRKQESDEPEIDIASNKAESLGERQFSHRVKMDEINFKHRVTSDEYRMKTDEKNFNHRTRMDEHRMKMDEKNFNHRATMDEQRAKDNALKAERDQRIADQKAAMDRAKLQYDIQKMDAEFRSKTQVKLVDNDVKKANELVPTTLSVTMHVKDGSSFGGVSNFIIGVKGILHPVQSNEMVSNLLNGFKSGSKFFNFLRWTTGEIAFLKDLIFNIDGIKDDVVKKHTGGSHWWTTLKRRKTLAKFKNLTGKNKIIPNASIVCSMEEVVELKEAYGLDIMNPKNIKKLMDQYFLLGFAIVDESQELCYFIFDGETDFEVISFKGLERDNNNKNDFKDIYKMINSGRL